MTKLPADWSDIPALLKWNAGHCGARGAIFSGGNQTLSHRQLHDHVAETVDALNRLGVGRGDRVAIVLPQGPDLAVAFLAVAAGATAAPLNPAYHENEFRFYLEDLQARALILPQGSDSPARAAAGSLGVPVIELIQSADGSGRFHLSGKPRPFEAPAGFATADDQALVLHTSGTTARPKIVPLSHGNVCASARHIRETLQLVPDDRCLNVMPLFHIHGLIGVWLSSIAAGAGVVCTPGFLAPKFFEWIESEKPTWYSAVPTMHQAILARADAAGDMRGRLRLIRSSSAALPPSVMAELERVFEAPVIESYGMTEAAHQMASNPLPPRQRKPGSVGLAAGPEVGIMDEAGHFLSGNSTGEIVIRGRNVTAGYQNNPEANARSFTDGWFRTGDQGYLDAEGYLFITGRLKELINRGGEKISPREIDEVLLAHPAVAQAVAFAMPDLRLGEEVAAAVVLRDGANVTPLEIREFVASRLADFKVPREIVILEKIPTGPTGKVQRIGLAGKLGLPSAPSASTSTEYVAPQTAMQGRLAAIWAEVLGRSQIGIHDRFLDLGGDSLLAAQLIARVTAATGVELSLLSLFDRPTVAGMEAALRESDSAAAMLQEVEQLTDAEAERLLAEESGPESNP